MPNNTALLELLAATNALTANIPLPALKPLTLTIGTDVERRAEKATMAARRLLGESATQERVEALAIALMPIEDANLDRVHLKEVDPDDPTGSRYDRDEVL